MVRRKQNNSESKKIQRNAEDERDQLIKELYKPVRVNFPRRRVEIRGKTDLLELDLADMALLRKEAKGYTMILVALNPYNRMCYARPLKSKTGKEVATNIESILKETKINFNSFWTDRGKEFKNVFFKELLKKYHINHYSTNTRIKTAHCERMIRTLKVSLYKAMEFGGTLNWVPLLPGVVKKINSSVHSRLKIIPNRITKKDEAMLNRLYSTPRLIDKNTRFKLNDHVRISNPPTIFRRAFKPYFSTSIYKIVGINYKLPHVYQIEDWQGNKLNRTFYQEELQKTKFPDVWLIEKVVTRKGNKCLVRWLGFSSEHDSWVNCKEIGKGRAEKDEK